MHCSNRNSVRVFSARVFRNLLALVVRPMERWMPRVSGVGLLSFVDVDLPTRSAFSSDFGRKSPAS